MFARVLALFPALLLASAAPAQSEPIDAALSEVAPAVIAAAKKQGLTNVGVLKFLVGRGTAPPRDDVGEINAALARRLEVAVTLANDDPKFGVLLDPAKTVTERKNGRANHLTADGRKAFFAHPYQLCWSSDLVAAGGLVAGTATFAADYKTVALTLDLFDKSGTLTNLVRDKVVATSPGLLAQAGLSYAVPGRTENAVADDARLAGMLKAATDPPAGDRPFAPLADSPVKLTVLYNGVPQPVRGSAVPEPQETDAVTFKLENVGDGPAAVALFVNGQSTLYREQVAPFAARKWVLSPGEAVTVKGFQVDTTHAEPFKVLSPDESAADVVNYGDHAGTFRMAVFRGELSETEPTAVPQPEATAATLVAIARGNPAPDGPKPLTLRSLQQSLRGRDPAAAGARGLVVPGGDKQAFGVKQVFFRPTPKAPVADITLRYYTPKGR